DGEKIRRARMIKSQIACRRDPKWKLGCRQRYRLYCDTIHAPFWQQLSAWNFLVGSNQIIVFRDASQRAPRLEQSSLLLRDGAVVENAAVAAILGYATYAAACAPMGGYR